MDSIISEGLSLMVYGMGFVFVFLTVLVGMTMTMSKLVVKFAPEPVVPPARAKRSSTAPAAKTNDDEVVAVITAAVHKYRS
jgi:oxaloacetate decarboxylase gamma subunit